MSVRSSPLIKPIWPFLLNHKSPQAAGLVAWWPMIHSGGNTLFDLSGLKRHASIVGAVWGGIAVESGQSALSFDGVDDFASVGLDLSGTNAICISAWAHINTGSGTKVLFEFSTNYNNGTGTFIVYAENDSLNVNVKGNNGYNFSIYAGRAQVAKWRHLVFSFDMSLTEETDMYEDGVLRVASSRPITTNNTGNFANETLYIGMRAGSSLPLACTLADVRVYDRRLSAADVYALYDPQSRYDLYLDPIEEVYKKGAAADASSIDMFSPMSGF